MTFKITGFFHKTGYATVYYNVYNETDYWLPLGQPSVTGQTYMCHVMIFKLFYFFDQM